MNAVSVVANSRGYREMVKKAVVRVKKLQGTVNGQSRLFRMASTVVD